MFSYEEFAAKRKSQFGYLKVDSGASVIRAQIVHKKKCYETFLEEYDALTIRQLLCSSSLTAL